MSLFIIGYIAFSIAISICLTIEESEQCGGFFSLATCFILGLVAWPIAVFAHIYEVLVEQDSIDTELVRAVTIAAMVSLVIMGGIFINQQLHHVMDEDLVNVEAFFRGEKDLGEEVELANVFSYLMTGALHISNPPEINIEDIDQDALRSVLTEEFWARQGN